jgi:hypothetical protein
VLNYDEGRDPLMYRTAVGAADETDLLDLLDALGADAHDLLTSERNALERACQIAEAGIVGKLSLSESREQLWKAYRFMNGTTEVEVNRLLLLVDPDQRLIAERLSKLHVARAGNPDDLPVWKTSVDAPYGEYGYEGMIRLHWTGYGDDGEWHGARHPDGDARWHSFRMESGPVLRTVLASMVGSRHQAVDWTGRVEREVIKAALAAVPA